MHQTIRGKFQSRNRGSYGFKISTSDKHSIAYKFQSRNRGSYGFKFRDKFASLAGANSSFNLVIEVLMVSRR